LRDDKEMRSSIHVALERTIIIFYILYKGESIIICNTVAFVFLLAALSFLSASLGVVSFLSQVCRFEVARSQL
jgi:hypothetical protein